METTKQLLIELEDILGGRLPEVFLNKVKLRPLKVGIFDDMITRYPAAKANELSAWLCHWTGHPADLNRISKGRRRYNLDGDDVEDIRKY